MQTYNKPPAGTIAVLLQTSRPGHPARLHRGARSGDVLMTPEACNLDQATNLVELGAMGEAVAIPDGSDLCERCFPNGVVAA